MVGIDLVFIPEFNKQLDLGGTTFLEKAFSLSEIKNSEAEHLAGLWAAKEAVIKAATVMPKSRADIIVAYDESGKPHAKTRNESFAISISHHGQYAIAVAYRIQA